ncbi:NAD(P)H-binding protein [Companilactobacillus heilongjiangensis]|uniref:NAD-dependent dehydratase n=1 Tax=Companilactobacillus heilongjiangensis TaxID=1074467 RepID=A0A0K2LD36_9LACO|nr:NAD(P)H-binding protein [Companilactobacillus heilongjiangensis]ALB29088.1 NAD-dependent dehydratase [Companilactobacillus heilongjiangensis]
MKKIIILGASGSIATLVEKILIDNNEVEMTLLARHPERIADDIRNDSRVKIVVGDVVKDYGTLVQAIKGQDVVYANLYGANLGKQGQSVVKAMNEAKVKRIVWISANGIYGEVPGKYGQWNQMMLGDTLTAYAAGAKAVEQSKLDYTIIRPAWFSDEDTISYELTQKGQQFKGTEVSRISVASYISSLLLDSDQVIKQSIGINKPNTDGSKPSFY